MHGERLVNRPAVKMTAKVAGDTPAESTTGSLEHPPRPADLELARLILVSAVHTSLEFPLQ